MLIVQVLVHTGHRKLKIHSGNGINAPQQNAGPSSMRRCGIFDLILSRMHKTEGILLRHLIEWRPTAIGDHGTHFCWHQEVLVKFYARTQPAGILIFSVHLYVLGNLLVLMIRIG